MTDTQEKKKRKHPTLNLEPKKHYATAPYNFVSLPYAAVAASLDQDMGWEDADQETVREFYQEYIREYGVLDGYLDLTITTKTPCFVGGNGSEFFAPSGQPMIPGSTVRGMVKNLFKIITCGTMRCDGQVEADFHDQRMYFRSMAATVKSFKKYYEEQLGIQSFPAPGGGHYSTSEAHAGFLVSDGHNNYYICPAKSTRGELDKNNNITNKVDWDLDSGTCDCYTGPMPNKKHYDIIWDGEWENPLIVPEEVLQAYANDKTRGNANGKEARDQGFNLLTNAKDGDYAREFTKGIYATVVPCFYMPGKTGNVKHFGFGRYYRVPYNKSIRNHVPEGVQKKVIDFSDAVFGKIELWGSRVYFEDALMQGEANVFPMANYTQPLLSPKPTSFQLYLEQKGEEPAHWDEGGHDIRGYKMYWHKRGLAKWEIDSPDNKIEGMIPIRPLKQGNVFKGRIRFTDLSEVELGALLKVFALGANDDELYYKLGQGKSLGMGSVAMTAELHIADRQKTYQSLFSEEGWVNSAASQDYDAYVQSFETYLDKIFTKLDDEDRKHNIHRKGTHKVRYELLQRELNRLLEWKKRPKDEKTGMMKIDDPDGPFQHRVILPDALDAYFN